MFERILLAVDGSEAALDAGRLLAALPLAPGTAIEVVHVLDSYLEYLLESVNLGERHHAQRAMRAAEEVVRREGLAVSSTLRKGAVAHEILRAARELKADLIVLGSHGLSGLEGFLLGSVALNVVKHAPCSVLIGRTLRYHLANVVVGTDGSLPGEGALQLAAAFPLPAATLHTLVHVLRPQHALLELLAIGQEPLYDRLRNAELEEQTRAKALLAAGQKLLLSSGKEAEPVLRTGDPASEILAVIEEQRADLVIVGARGASLVEGLLTGSVADRLLAKAECSVLLAREFPATETNP